MSDASANVPSCLSPVDLAGITRFASLDDVTYQDVAAVVRECEVNRFKPNPEAALDPRTDLWINYSEARRRRPVSGDTVTGERAGFDGEDCRQSTPCIVCRCQLTPAIDVADLRDGKTFITFNLYPMVFPFAAGSSCGGQGLHLLQWCSTHHEADLHNLFTPDVAVILKRLAALEQFLLHSGAPGFPRTDGGRHTGYAAIMKNRGLKVGGSVEHGHQQITHLSVLPRAIAADRDFLAREGVPYATSLRQATTPELIVAEYAGGLRVVVSPFMRRPLEAVILPAPGAGEYLHDLDEDTITQLATALRETTGALALLMEARKLSFDYNLAFHTGPVGLLYVEILPYTQPYGGFEHLGHYLCQEEPGTTARCYREVLGFADPPEEEETDDSDD